MEPQPYINHGRVISLRLIRRVWAAVTEDPQISVRELALQLGYQSTSDTASALQILRDAGYIDYDFGVGRARTVIVPFRVDKRIKEPKWTIRG